jgi:hypothetical protein
MLSGCARTGSESFRVRASQDLQCPADDIHVVHKWEGKDATKLAQGCGREAYYERQCEREGCLWKRVR